MEEEPDGAQRLRLWDRATLDDEDWLIPLPVSGQKDRAGIAKKASPPAGSTSGGVPSTMPELSERLRQRVLSALSDGPGLAVLRGLRLNGLSDQACAELCRSVISVAGTPRPRESAAPMDDLLTTQAAQPPAAESGASPIGAEVAALAPHTDRAGPPGPPHLLALLCVRPALVGGDSLLISGPSVHRRLLAEQPAVLPELFRDFHFGAEPALARTGPVFTRVGNRIAVQYNRYQIERGHQAAGNALTPAQKVALDAFDEALHNEALILRLPLLRGDLLMLDNHTLLHGRTAYSDPHGHRCLTRAWAD